MTATVKAELRTGLALNPEPGPGPTFIFEALLMLESQIYQVSQDVHNCWVSKSVVYEYSCRYTVLSHPK